MLKNTAKRAQKHYETTTNAYKVMTKRCEVRAKRRGKGGKESLGDKSLGDELTIEGIENVEFSPSTLRRCSGRGKWVLKMDMERV